MKSSKNFTLSSQEHLDYFDDSLSVMIVPRGIGCSLEVSPPTNSCRSLESRPDSTRVSLSNSASKWRTQSVSCGSFNASDLALASQSKLRETIKNSKYSSDGKKGLPQSEIVLEAQRTEEEAKLDEGARQLLGHIISGSEMTQTLREMFIRNMALKEVEGSKGVFVVDQDSARHKIEERGLEKGLSAMSGVSAGARDEAKNEVNRGYIRPIDELLKSLSVLRVEPVVEHELEAQVEEVSPPIIPLDRAVDKEDGFSNGEIDDLLREASDYSTKAPVVSLSSSDSATPLLEGRLVAAKKHPVAAPNVSWASTARLSDVEYESLRPLMAMQYPFELDAFQKQAIMRLERRECVFVAAHTSAGKTVVAEYAIAMACRHGSRAIYTSPIKALSNQKYRDFKSKFGQKDVGLLTGDVSVNPEASCLIMTTEILRSMLYRGSDIVRDIEFVIFDEVHYVNDAERGVVWEEVIIMLPDRINMIFLSATTPNTLEFCDWIGRTKRRPVYITSTSRRPVPLQHFLLHDDHFYKIKQGETGFQPTAIQAAIKLQKEKAKPKQMTSANAAMKNQRVMEKAAIASQNAGKKVSSSGYKGGGGRGNSGTSAGRHTSSSGNKDQWLSLLRVLRGGGRAAIGGLSAVDFGIGTTRYEVEKARRTAKAQLEKYERLPAEFRAQVSKREYERGEIRVHDDQAEDLDELCLLPVVIFCFSKRKCEEIADHFATQDLLSAKGKGAVGLVLSDMRARLSDADAKLPQVKRVEEMVARGIGVHTGGLLPLLKEATEVLFAKGLIKVLVATETFAMGVNMPAKSVVFNGFRKHDGNAFRDLLPGEYTQMAGRAGRRGLDKVGTVIIASWGDVPGESQIRTLLTGTASKLSSKFRLTYGMIVNLLRSSDLTVEDMMKRSFSEFHTQRALSGLNIEEKIHQSEQMLQTYRETQHILALEMPTTGWGMEEIMSCEETFVDAQCTLTALLWSMRRSHANRFVECLCSGRMVWLLPTCGEGTDSDGDQRIRSPVPAVLLASPVIVKRAGTETMMAWFLLLLGDGTHILLRLPLTVVGIITCHVVPVPTKLTKASDSPDSPPRDMQEAAAVELVKQAAATVVRALKAAIDCGSPSATKECDTFLGALNLASTFNLTTFDILDLNLHLVDAAKGLDLPLPCIYFNETLQLHFRAIADVDETRRNIAALEHYLSSSSLALFPDFGNRQRVLKQLGYVDRLSDIVLIKGRVACEINTAHELLTTELIFNNVFEPLTPPEAAALLSALVFEEKSDKDENGTLTSRLEVAREISERILEDINVLQDEESVATDEENKPTLNFGLSASVFLWAQGLPFSDITAMTVTQEGSIVRCITRLDELCRDVRNAARVIGNASLFRKMDAASMCIKRDIVFAASMYI